jgi:tetratricopeptide (TPR) repeat protein
MPSPPEPPRRPLPTRTSPPRDYAQEEENNRQLTVANIQFRRGQMAEAEKAVQEILAVRPGDAAANELLADIRLAKNDFDGAQQALKAALSAEPGRSTAEAKMARAVLRGQERQRMASLGVAYAASDTALMRLSDGSRRSRQWAAFGSALIPGLGQYVNGETTKGIVIAAVYFLTIVVLSQMPDTRGLAHQVTRLLAGRHIGTTPVRGFSWFLLLLMLADWLYAVIDAAMASRRAAAPSSRDDGWQV